jgi:hypothetical protein
VSGAERRLTRLTTQLSPTQAWLLWREEAYSHGSMEAYVQSLQGQPDSAYPLYRLPEQMEQVVRQAMKGEKDHARVERAVRQAQKDVAFLHYLGSQFNSRLHGEKRALFLHLLLVIHEVRHWMQNDDPFATLGLGWEHTAGFVIEVFGYQQAHQRISEQYFQGLSPLFPDLAEALAALVEQTENVITMFNDHLDFQQHVRGKRKRKDFVPAQPLVLDDLRCRAESAAEHHMEVLVGMARAEASMMMGERKAAYGYVEPLVWGG